MSMSIKHRRVVVAVAVVAVLGSLPGAGAAAPRGVRLSYTRSAGVAEHVTVSWNTDDACDGEVRYGLARDALDLVAVASTQASPIPEVGYQHEARIEGLTLQTRYYYQVVSPTCGDSDIFSFRTGADDPCVPFTFVAGGDTRSVGDTGASEFFGLYPDLSPR